MISRLFSQNHTVWILCCGYYHNRALSIAGVGTVQSKAVENNLNSNYSNGWVRLSWSFVVYLTSSTSEDRVSLCEC